MHSFTLCDNRSAHVLLGYKRRGTYVRGRVTSGTLPGSEGEGSSNSVEDGGEDGSDLPDPIVAEPISAIPISDSDRSSSGYSASTSSSAAEAPPPQHLSPDPFDALMAGPKEKRQPRAPAPLGGARPSQARAAGPSQAARKKKSTAVAAGTAAATGPPAPTGAVQTVPVPPSHPSLPQADPNWEAAAQAQMQLRRPALPPEDVRGAQKQRVEPEPFFPPLVYRGRHVTAEDTLETPDISMACARAILLPPDVAIHGRRSMASNVTRAIQGNLIVSILPPLFNMFLSKYLCSANLSQFQEAQRAAVMLDQVRKMEVDYHKTRDVVDELEKAAAEHALYKKEAELFRKEAELKLAEAANNLSSATEQLNSEKESSAKLQEEYSKIKEDTMTLAAKNNSLEAALAAEKEYLSAKNDELNAVQESIEDLKVDAYDEGVRATEIFYHADWERARTALYEEAWTAALKAAGIAEDHDLYKNIPVPPPQPEPEPTSSQPEQAASATEADAPPPNGEYDVGVLVPLPEDDPPPPPPATTAEDETITIDE